jgi:hypothetical protein
VITPQSIQQSPGGIDIDLALRSVLVDQLAVFLNGGGLLPHRRVQRPALFK